MQATSQAFQITPEHAASALSALRPERSQFLKKLSQLLLRMAREQGSAALCEQLSLPEFVLKVLNGEMLVQPAVKRGRTDYQPEPQADFQPDYQPDYPTEYKPDYQTEYKPDYQTEYKTPDYQDYEYAAPTGLLGSEYSTQASLYTGVDYDDEPPVEPPAFYGRGPVQQVQAKVKAMYDTGMDIRLIQALYAIPPVLVHSWGDFTRSKKAEKLRRLKRLVTEKMSRGEELSEAVKGLRMTKLHAEHILGMCEEMEAARAVSEDKRFEVIEEAKKAPRPGNVARKFGIPKMTLHRWMRGDFTHNDGESAYVMGDEWGSASQKRRCLETFYLNKRDVSRTITATGLNEDKLAHIVEDFETRVATRAPKEDEDPYLDH